MPKDFSQLSLTYNFRWFREDKISGSGEAQNFGDVTLAFEKDSAFNIEMPVFTAMPDKDVMRRANDMLRGYYRNSLTQNRDCINGLREEPKQPFEPEYTLSFLCIARVVSVQEFGSVFCGGAHPNNYVSYRRMIW